MLSIGPPRPVLTLEEEVHQVQSSLVSQVRLVQQTIHNPNVHRNTIHALVLHNSTKLGLVRTTISCKNVAVRNVYEPKSLAHAVKCGNLVCGQRAGHSGQTVFRPHQSAKAQVRFRELRKSFTPLLHQVSPRSKVDAPQLLHQDCPCADRRGISNLLDIWPRHVTSEALEQLPTSNASGKPDKRRGVHFSVVQFGTLQDRRVGGISTDRMHEQADRRLASCVGDDVRVELPRPG
jgi:hypothetical protein